jgi:L-lactate dehydrogenase complex protein LldG
MSEQSKQKILNRIRGNKLPAVDLPEVIHGNWIRYDDPVAQIGKMVEFVGGSFECLPSVNAVQDRLKSFPQMQQAKRVLSLVDGIEGNVNLDQVPNPHDLDDLDFMIFEGDLGVAENGAVWITDANLKHRVVLFINQHLIIVMRRQRIVHNMHEAYAQIRVPGPGFGCFVSGPSKTADIEQSLVIGAHGCRSMQMYVIP